ncbi:MAG: 30S ribosomal protein S17 [Thermoanaerobaculum sp.]
MENRGESRKTVKVGTVVSLAGAKSVVVQVESMVMHPLYHRFVKRSRKFMAHDENGECGLGDKVQIVECRPLSRRKRFRVQRVVERAK